MALEIFARRLPLRTRLQLECRCLWMRTGTGHASPLHILAPIAAQELVPAKLTDAHRALRRPLALTWRREAFKPGAAPDERLRGATTLLHWTLEVVGTQAENAEDAVIVIAGPQSFHK